MFSSRTARLFIAFVMVFVVVNSLGYAQEASAEQDKFWKGFAKISAGGDEKKILNYIRRQKEIAIESFDFYFVAFATQSSIAVDEATFKVLALKMEEVFKNSIYTYRLEFYLNLNQPSRESWARAWNMFVTAYAAYNEGKENNNPYKTGEAMEMYTTSLEIFEYLGDLIAQTDLLLRLAECSELVEEEYNACVYFHKALEAFGKLPDKHHDLKMIPENLEIITTRHQEYLDRGFDPTKPRFEGGEPTDEEVTDDTEETVVDDGALRMASFFPVDDKAEYDVWELKYTTMKSASDFVTPSYFTGFNYLLWPRLWYDSSQSDSVNMNPFYLNNVYYFGFYAKPLMLTHNDGTFYVEVDGNKKTRSEIRATTKPSKVVVRDVEKGSDKKPYECQLFVQSPGEQESMFGLTVNNADPDVTRLNLRMRVGWYTKGKIHGETCMLIDDNCSGTLNEIGYPMEGDTLTNGDYIHWCMDAMVVGKEKIARPMSNYMRFGDKYYHVKMDPYGRKFETKEVKVDTGRVRLDWKGDTAPDYLVLHLVDDSYFFVNVAGTKEAVEVPIGQYEIACGKIETRKKNDAKQIRIYNGNLPYVEVYRNKETVLKLGAPFTFTFDTEVRTGDEEREEFAVIGKSLNVWGRGGEVYCLFFDEPPLPKVSIRDKASKTLVVKSEDMRAADIDRFYMFDRNSVWFPMDYAYELKSSGELEARLEQKKIPLLGGPAKSDWH